VFIAVHNATHPSEFYCQRAVNGRISFADAERFHRSFREMDVEALVYCSLGLERHAAPRTPTTVRVKATESTTGRDPHWLMDWYSIRNEAALADRVADAGPRLPAAAELRVTRTLDGPQWGPAHCLVHAASPFVVELECDEGAAGFLARCNGSRTTSE